MFAVSRRAEATTLPSIPPSPSLLDEVFGQPRPWSVRLEESVVQHSRPSSFASIKGKGRQASDGEDEHTPPGSSVQEAYPPTTDEAAETQRVEETLKRWELAERQRRKSVRESTHQSTSSGPSLFASVTRTASLVLSRRSRAGSMGGPAGPNGTRAFKSHDAVDVTREGYGVPLDDMDRARPSAGDVAVHSPSPSLFDRSASASLDAGPRVGTGSDLGSRGLSTSENPFVHPSERVRTSTSQPLLVPVSPTHTLRPSTPPSPTPFSDTHVRLSGSADLTMRISGESSVHARKRSSVVGASTFTVPPIPQPLGLLSTPVDAPRAVPLQPTLQPILRPPRREEPEEGHEVRWWHDWLCGCSEGPDRGGDNQAGRTNPFE